MREEYIDFGNYTLKVYTKLHAYFPNLPFLNTPLLDILLINVRTHPYFRHACENERRAFYIVLYYKAHTKYNIYKYKHIKKVTLFNILGVFAF